MRILRLLFLVLCLASCVKKKQEVPPEFLSVATTAPLIGQDYYAIQSQYWNLNATVKYSREAKALGNLHNTFGTSLSPIRSLLSAIHPVLYRVHLINTVCVRNSNCGKYELGYGYSKASFDLAVKAKKPAIIRPFRAQVKIYCDLFQGFPETRLLISPALEHDLSKESWRVLADETLNVCPGVQLVNAPDGGVQIERYRDAWIERHGSTPGADSDIVSLDGADATQIDIDKFLKRARNLPRIKVIELWTAGYNCRVGTWQDPRVRKNCSSGKTIELMNHIYESLPAAPTFSGTQCKKMSAFKDPDIWKPLAESSVNYDPRSELPVLISKGFGKLAVNVLDRRGSKQGSLGYYGTYLDQGFRWYSGYSGGSKDSGYDFQSKAENSGGSGFIWLQQGTDCKGPLYTGRRQGRMRDK